MYIIEVIPLTLLPQNAPQLLSYFFDRNLEKGVVVEVFIGKRRVIGVVVASTSLENQKISLKKSSFQLKKLSKVLSEAPQVSETQLKIALWLSRHYNAPLGYCLKTVLPSFFLKSKAQPLRPSKVEPLETTRAVLVKPTLLLTPAKSTLFHVLPLIKDALEDNGQIALIVPDASTINYFYKSLLPKYKIGIVTSSLKNKELYNTWNKIFSDQIDVVLGTRQTLFMPFSNLKLIIVDDPLNEAYKSDMTPKYNTPDLAKAIANMYGAEIIFTSPIAGVDGYYQIEKKGYDFKDGHLLGGEGAHQIKVLNMIEEFKNNNYSVLSREFKTQILAAIKEKNKKILIFSPRRGHSGILVCNNCGYAAKCPDCDLLSRIHKTAELILTCHHCFKTQPMPKNCPNCKSFNLKAVGPVGTQKIYEEVQRLLMMNSIKTPVLILDTDVIKNETEEEEIIEEMNKPRSSIIIATQMIFSHRYDFNFNLIGVVNADSLVSFTDFRTEEMFFYQIAKLLDFLELKDGHLLSASWRSEGALQIQTYNPNNKIMSLLSDFSHQNLIPFYKRELQIRKMFSYPPFSNRN